MTGEDRSDYITKGVLSKCCGAFALGEVDTGTMTGICADCHDHADFEETTDAAPEGKA